MPEVWTMGVSLPKLAARAAERAESAGFDGIAYVDSQNLSGDTYIALAMAAAATTRLKLATGVTNPYTRHPAVAASAIATVQAESDGRAVLGIGRGDSSLAHLGLAPAPVRHFERYLERLQGYLRGEDVSFQDTELKAVDSLGLAEVPRSSRLSWLRPTQPKVPVDVAATGPKVIALGARLAERVTLAVGADPERVAWAVDVARTAAPDLAALSIGAYVNVVAHDDVGVARELASGSLATFARFSAMHGRASGRVSAEDKRVLERVHDAYDMTRHTYAGAAQTRELDPAFVDRFGIVGSADRCVSRLRELVSLGVERFVVVGPSAGADRSQAGAATERFAREVLPALR